MNNSMFPQRVRPEMLYKFRGLLWQPVQETRPRTGEITYDVEAMPYCPKCKAKLTQRSEYDVYCDLCEEYYKAEPSTSHVAGLASKAFNAKIKEGWKIETLDLPPGVVKSEDENDDYWVEARIGQKDGKKMAIVYFGEKKRGEQSKKDYSQVFLDFDDEQMRFDKGNKNPMEVIGKLKAEFLNSKHVSEKRSKD